MDILLIVCGLILCLVGIIGSVIPVIPGPPFGWVGLLLLELTDAIPNNYWFLGITFVIAIGIFILDYFMPAISTKKFGGSKAGAIGAIVGLIVGLLAPIPFGFLIGPFIGAFIGEIAFNKSESKQALKAAFGSFLGFIASAFMKLLVSFIFLGFFIWDVVSHWSAFF
ncbi:MAG: DUF456 domain-containing protein [Bacteroidetes bacterium]|nr:DUF456 domain-containing protein [Bacteroidota bacterium]